MATKTKKSPSPSKALQVATDVAADVLPANQENGDATEVTTTTTATATPTIAEKLSIKSVTGVDPTKIYSNPDKNYSRFNAKYIVDDVVIRNLAYQMSLVGNKNAITIINKSDNPEYQAETVIGFNRVAAGKLICKGFDWVDGDGNPVKVHNPDFKLKVQLFVGNERERRMANMQDNTMVRGLTAMDYAKMVRDCEDILLLTPGQTADIIGKDKTAVSQFRKLLTIPDEIQEQIANGSCATSWRTLAKITEIGDEEMRNAEFQRVLDGDKITYDDIKRSIMNRADKVAQEAAAAAAAALPVVMEDRTVTNEDGTTTVVQVPVKVQPPADPNDEKATVTPAPASTRPQNMPRMQLTPKNHLKFYEDCLVDTEQFGPLVEYFKFMLLRIKGEHTDTLHLAQLETLVKDSCKLMFLYIKHNKIDMSTATFVPTFVEMQEEEKTKSFAKRQKAATKEVKTLPAPEVAKKK